MRTDFLQTYLYKTFKKYGLLGPSPSQQKLGYKDIEIANSPFGYLISIFIYFSA